MTEHSVPHAGNYYFSPHNETLNPLAHYYVRDFVAQFILYECKHGVESDSFIFSPEHLN
jgi:hypothetical protein